ncbi:OmpP1/FadL family transporter [Palleronia caenipelagi]|nr:outer membrane beta-barrel protein [Palleronia caenipelagi]
MKRTQLLATAATVALLPAAASAIGLDRSGQDVGVLFSEGNYFEFSAARAFAHVDGRDVNQYVPGTGIVAFPGGAKSGDAAGDFNLFGAGLKYELNDQWSFAVILDQPFGSDVKYNDGPAIPTPGADRSNLLGGTSASVDSEAITALARYKFNDNYSVHGGFHYTRLDADVSLGGLAFAELNGYKVDFDKDGDFGFVVGAAYERPELALRVALTYRQGTTHKMHTKEDVPAYFQQFGLPSRITSTTEIDTPDSVNLDFQTGLNEKTLLFGQIRYAWYEDVKVAPDFFDAVVDPSNDGDSISDIDDGYSLTLGVGRKLTDRLSGSITFGYEHRDDDDLVSPLSPSNGQKSIGLGLAYQATDQIRIAGGVRYVTLGDAKPETGTPDVARAKFDNNHVIVTGMEIGYSF